MRRRLVLAIAGVAAVAVLLLAVPLGVVLSRHYRDEDLLRLQRDAVAATREIDVPGRRGDRIELPRSERHARGVRPRRAPDRRAAARPRADTVAPGARAAAGRPTPPAAAGCTVAAPLLVASA